MPSAPRFRCPASEGSRDSKRNCDEIERRRGDRGRRPACQSRLITRQSITAAKCRPAPVTTKAVPDRVLEAQPLPGEERRRRRNRRCRRRRSAKGGRRASVSSTGRRIDDAAPADREIEDDRQPVEAAGQEQLDRRCRWPPRPRRRASIVRASRRVVELREEGRVGARRSAGRSPHGRSAAASISPARSATDCRRSEIDSTVSSETT